MELVPSLHVRSVSRVMLALLLMAAASAAEGSSRSDSAAGGIVVTGRFDWSIVPANVPPFLHVGTDGELYPRDVPLVGTFTLTGSRIAIDGKISVLLSGELDATGTGVFWFPTTLTATIDGVKTIIFQGDGQADAVGLVTTGTFSLEGRGPYAGAILEFRFEETGPGNTDTYTFRGRLTPRHR